MKLFELIEGRNDPHTHKAIFMLGGPGSGKTHVASKLSGGTGLRSVNVDEFYELLRDKQGLKGGFDDELYKYSGNLTQKKLDLLLGGRIGLVIDGTGRKIERLEEIKSQLEELGYDTMAVFVNTELNKALDRNEERRRKADSNWVRKVHADLKSKLGSLQQIFGGHLLIVDNTEDETDFTDAQRQVGKFLSAPNVRPKSWPVQEDEHSPDARLRKNWDDDIEGGVENNGDEAAYYKRVAMKLLRDAKDFIGESGTPLKLAYRGYERFENLPFHRPYRANRLPKDSTNAEQQIYNAAINAAGGTATRSNSIFASGNFVQARKYGEVYVVFPIGDFNYTYHTSIADWFDQYGGADGVRSWKDFLELTVGKDPMQTAHTVLRKAEELDDVETPGQALRNRGGGFRGGLANAAKSFIEITNGIVADEKLRAGLDMSVEILLSAKGGYYYVPEHYFFKYVRPYLEINGLQVEDKPPKSF